MSPVAPSGSNHVGRAALVALVGVIVLFAGLGLVTLALGDRDSPDLALGDQTFDAGNAERLAGEIANNGPVLYSDVSGRRDRDMILQHLGDDPETGWYAFLAAPVDRARDCFWRWEPDENQFRASCDDELTALADGTGLPQFPVTIDDGRLDIDLNADARQTTSTTTTTAADDAD